MNFNNKLQFLLKKNKMERLERFEKVLQDILNKYDNYYF